MSDSTVLGVLLLARHGDRQGFYQNPDTYTASKTAITALGAQQEFQLGQLIRSLYFNDTTSPSHIQNISTGLFNQAQIDVRADAGGEGGVIYDSALALVQGLWPASPAFNTTLSDGTNVPGPLGGYQYVPIESVEPDQDVSLEGWTSCGVFTNATDLFYDSAAFKQRTSEAASFLASLQPHLDGRNTSLENMWNIFDYMNVNYIHNQTFRQQLPPTYLEQARALANWHEYNVFSSPAVDGIGNIAGRTIIPSVLEGLNDIANSSNPIKFVYQAISYKPFLSLFNMTGAAAQTPALANIVEYAAVVALEVRQPSGSAAPVVRFNFKNGTNDAFAQYPWFNQSGDVPLSTVISYLQPAAINSTEEWCSVCSNSNDRGCAELAAAAAAASQTSKGGHSGISAVGAGFVGAAVTAAVLGAALAALVLLGCLSFGRKNARRGTRTAAGHDTYPLGVNSVDRHSDTKE